MKQVNLNLKNWINEGLKWVCIYITEILVFFTIIIIKEKEKKKKNPIMSGEIRLTTYYKRII